MSTEPDPPPSSLSIRADRDAASRPRPYPVAAAERCEIDLQNPRRYREAAIRRWRAWLRPIVAELAPTAESLALRFTDDDELRRLNATFRHRDQPTDVLSFPGVTNGVTSDAPSGAAEALDGHLGDVAISVPAARRQARDLGHGVERELRILALHGILHCLGYDHETDDGAMERLEERLRARFLDREPVT